MHTKSCRHCGNEFKSRRSDAIYCRMTCRTRHLRGHPPAISCRSCGADMGDRHRNAKFCEPCRADRDKCKATERIASIVKVCPWCKKGFSGVGTYCSRSCGGRSSREVQLSTPIPRECIACGDPFVTHNVRQKTCCNPCMQWSNKYPGVRRSLEAVCEYCGKVFVGTKAGMKYCAPVCGKRMSKHNRRAREAGAFVEVVTLSALSERDGWDCGICGEPVDREAAKDDPMKPSIDHIHPISRGGEHSLTNTQIAHLRCNVAKGARVAEQVSLGSNYG